MDKCDFKKIYNTHNLIYYNTQNCQSFSKKMFVCKHVTWLVLNTPVVVGFLFTSSGCLSYLGPPSGGSSSGASSGESSLRPPSISSRGSSVGPLGPGLSPATTPHLPPAPLCVFDADVEDGPNNGVFHRWFQQIVHGPNNDHPDDIDGPRDTPPPLIDNDGKPGCLTTNPGSVTAGAVSSGGTAGHVITSGGITNADAGGTNGITNADGTSGVASAGGAGGIMASVGGAGGMASVGAAEIFRFFRPPIRFFHHSIAFFTTTNNIYR